MHGPELLTMILMVALLVHGLPHVEHYISPAPEMISISAAWNIKTQQGIHTTEDCALLCTVTPKCVAFVTSAPGGGGTCKLKNCLVTSTKRLDPKRGNAYFYLGMCNVLPCVCKTKCTHISVLSKYHHPINQFIFLLQ